MASLGNIWFDLGLKDNTDKDLEKIIKKLEKQKVDLKIDIDNKGFEKTIRESVGSSSELEKNFSSLSKTLGIADSKAKEITNSINEQNTSELALLQNAERITRAKERLLQMERDIVFYNQQNSTQGREILSWAKRTREELDKINIGDKSGVIKGTGASLTAEINARKDILKTLRQETAEKARIANREIQDNKRIERSLLRVKKIRDRINNDKFRKTDDYEHVFQALDKLELRLKSLRTSSSSDVDNALSINFNKSVHEIENLIKKQDNLTRDTAKQTSHMGRMWSQLNNQIKGVISIYAVQRFTRQLIEMGGEFEKQHYALRAIVGDISKADRVFNNLRKVAVESPFHFGDFTSYAKQLAAYSIPINEIYETTVRLADVSSGLGVDMSRIILAYGQIRAASYLRGQEVRQLTEAGIPIVEELANKLTELNGVAVTTGEVFDKISAREIPFEMVKDIFFDMTNEGGKFYKMQKVLAQSLSGKWANLTSHYQIMLYDVAQDANSELHKLIEGLTYLVKNFDMVRSGIHGAIAAYGLIKGANIFRGLTKVTDGVMKFNKVLSSSTFQLNAVFVVIGALIATFNYFMNKQEKINQELGETVKLYKEEAEVVNNSIDSLKELTKSTEDNVKVQLERNKVLADLAKTEPGVANSIRDHADNIEYLTKKQDEYNATMLASKRASIQLTDRGVTESSVEEKELDIENKKNNIEKYTTRLINDYYAFLGKHNDDVEKAIMSSLGSRPFNRYGDEIVKVLLDDSKELIDRLIEAQEIVNNYAGVKQQGMYRPNLFKVGSFFSMGSSGILSELNIAKGELKSHLMSVDEDIEEIKTTIINTLKDKGFVEGITEGWHEMVLNAINAIPNIGEEYKKRLIESLIPDYEAKEGNENLLDGWRDRMNDILKGLVTITNDTSIDELGRAIKSKLKEVQDILDSVNITGASSSDDDVSKAQEESYNRAKEHKKLLEKALEMLHLNKDANKKTKDVVAERFNKELDLLKKAKSAYEKYIPLLGKVNALEKINSDIRFKDVGFNPDTFNDSLKKIYDQLGNTDEQKKLKGAILDLMLEGDFDKVKEKVDDNIRGITKYIESNRDRWNLFDKLFEKTGDRKTSFELAFGTTSDDDIKNYIDSLTSKFNQLAKGRDMTLEKMLELDSKEIEDTYGKELVNLIEEIKKARQKAREDLLLSDAEAISKTLSLEEQALKVRQEYQDKIDRTDNQDAKESYLKLMNQELAELNTKAIQLLPIWKELFVDSAEYGSIRLNALNKASLEMLSNFREERDLAGELTGNYEMLTESGERLVVSSELYQRLLKKIQEHNTKLNADNPFRKMADSFSKLFSGDGNKSKTELLADIEELGVSIQESAQYVRGLGDDLGALFGDDTGDLISGIADGIEGIGQAGVGVAKLINGDIVGGIKDTIGGAAKLKKAFTSGKKEHKEALKRIKEQQRAIQHSYEIAKKTLEMQIQSTIFGTDSWKSITSSANVYAKTIGSVQDSIRKLDRLEIVVGSRRTKGFLGLGRKQKDVYGGILDAYPKLIKANGELDIQLAKTLSSEAKFKGDHKEILDMLIEDAELLKEAYENISESLANIFGELGQTITDAFVDAFKNGTDAMEGIYKSANEMIENLTTQFIVSATLTPFMEQMSKEAMDLMLSSKNEESKLIGMYDIIDRFIDGTIQISDGLTDYIEYAQKLAKEKGFDIYVPDDVESNLGKGIQSLTEDTAQLLASYLNAIRQDVSVSRRTLVDLSDAIDGMDIGNNIGQAVAQLTAINANTLRSANGVDEINSKLDKVMNGSRSFRVE